MQKVTFITGNANKAKYLEKYLSYPIEHLRLELDEIQSLDPREIVEHKVRQAFEKIETPVLVEDVSLEFSALGKLPGPFIKFFEQSLGLEGICRLLDGRGRDARARCTFGYFDGKELKFFEGSVEGTISEHPKGEHGYGWDQIFIPYFSEKTGAELDEKGYERFYKAQKPLGEIKDFLFAL